MFINPVKFLQIPNQNRRVKTPTVLQMEAVECGAAALGIVLGYYGRTVPLAELRQTCGVSRDGVTAANVLKAARRYGMEAKGFKKQLASLQQLRPPFIVFWHFNHFLVVEGFSKGRVYLNDPALGPRTVSDQEFDEGYTGVVLLMEPGDEFERGGHKPSIVNALSSRLRGSIGALLYCITAGFLLVIPNLALPAFSQIFVDNVLVKRQLNWLPYLLIGMALIVSLQGVLTLLQLRYLRGLKIKLAVSMASRFVWHVLRLPASFYAQRYAGEISSRVKLNDDVANVLSGRLTTTVISVVMVGFYAIAMLQYSPILTIIVVCFALVNVFTLQWVARRRVDANLRLVQEYGKAAGVAISGLQSMETLKASGLESDFFARWSGYYTKANNAQQDLGLMNRIVGILPALLSALTAMSLLVIGGLQVINGSLTVGMLIAFQLLMQSFQQPVNRLVQFGSTLQNLQGNLDRLDDVLDNPVDSQLQQETGEWMVAMQDQSVEIRSHSGMQDAVAEQCQINPQALSTHYHLPATPRLLGYIDLKDICFGYNPLEAPLIENFNLSIKPGQRVAFIGSSGSGKSTLAKVIAGLFEPSSGEIYFDGIPRSQIPRSILTNSIAVVEQDILLFSGTVRENLTLWDTTIPDTTLQRACRDAAIEDVILSIPGGYDAP
ncbi:MAG TPA: NHLP family bacteriocin export ABC transporter peptidase/permease/ATPase subunit, partial [Allocoleopsis sp.]